LGNQPGHAPANQDHLPSLSLQIGSLAALTHIGQLLQRERDATMEDQQILDSIDQQRLRNAYLREQIGQVTQAKDHDFAARLVELVLGTRTQSVKQAAIEWVIQHLGKF